MDGFIREQNLEYLMNIPFHDEFKVVTHGQKGVFNRDFALNGGNDNSIIINNILNGLRIEGYFKLNENEYEDKLELRLPSVVTMDKRIAERFMFEKSDPKETIFTNVWGRRLLFRKLIIAGFAFSGLISGTRVTGFIKNHVLIDRRFWVDNEDIWLMAAQHVDYTGNIEVDFENMFKYLWLHYPQDLTGKDAEIKRITLEQGLLEQKFGYRM